MRLNFKIFRNNLIWSIIIGYLLITAVPFLCSYLLTATYWWNSSKDVSVGHSENKLQFTKDIFDSHLQQMEKLSGLLYSKHDLLDVLKSNPLSLTDQQRVEINQIFDKLFFDMSYTRSDVLSFYFFDLDGNLRYRNGDSNSYYKYQIPNVYFDEWFEHTKIADGKTFFIGKALSFQDDNRSFFSIARLIKSPPSSIGIVLIDFDFQVLENAIRKSTTENSQFIVSDFNGNILIHNQDKSTKQMLEPILQQYVTGNLSGSKTMKIKDKSYLVVYDTIERYSIKLIHMIPVKTLVSGSMNYMLRINMFISIIMIILAAISIFYFHKRLTPLKKLAYIMKKNIHEPFDQRVAVMHEDEIGQISRSFNSMMNHLQNLFQLEYKSRLEKSETEKALLEAQINPHFLYNTLDTIRFKAIEHHNEEIAEMIYALSTNLRYTISNISTKVTVKEEVAWLERYIYLQKMRFKTRFDVFFQIDVTIYGKQIYRLILQPFIENAIIHGFQNTKSGGLLHINAHWEKSSNELIFEIVDNGCGFAYELNKRVTHDSFMQLYHDRIGMHNAVRRLFLYYGASCQVYIRSIPGKQTAIKIMIKQED